MTKNSFVHFLSNCTFVVPIEAGLQQLLCRVIFNNPAYGRNWLSQHLPKIAPRLDTFSCPYRNFWYFLCHLILHFLAFVKTFFFFYFWKNKMKKKSDVMRHVSQVTCHMSGFKCHMSHVICHLSQTPRVTTSYLPLLTPQSSAVKGGQDSEMLKR